MNLVLLKGNVGQDPKITSFKEGGKVAQFTLATTERGFTTKDGREVEPQTTWHNIVVRKTGLAGICEQYVRKGSPLLLTGHIQNRSYEDSAGQTRYITEVIADEIELLGGKKGEAAPAPAPEYSGGGSGQPAVYHAPHMGDDLPF